MSFQPQDNNVINYYTTLGKTFIVDTGLVTTSLVEIPVFLLRNPSGSSIKANIYRYSFGVDVGKMSRICIYAKPTVTSTGTSLTPACMRQTSSDQATGIITTFKSPIVSAKGTLMKTFIIHNTLSAGALNPVEFNCNFLFEAGADLLITCESAINGMNIQVCCEYIEG